jgi:hypothetical protein
MQGTYQRVSAFTAGMLKGLPSASIIGNLIFVQLIPHRPHTDTQDF